MEEWFVTGAAHARRDPAVLGPRRPVHAGGTGASERKLYRTADQGNTLRENFGLRDWASRWLRAGVTKREAADKDGRAATTKKKSKNKTTRGANATTRPPAARQARRILALCRLPTTMLRRRWCCSRPLLMRSRIDRGREIRVIVRVMPGDRYDEYSRLIAVTWASTIPGTVDRGQDDRRRGSSRQLHGRGRAAAHAA